METIKQEMVNNIINWYQKNKRMLPWRKDKNPYHIWISEIMLQQTKIEAVKKYYNRFIQEIPDVKNLSKIEEERLLKLWEGLGYYTRARNLQKAAKIITNELNGKFPTKYEELIKLPGIGEYTASAITSISFQEQVATVDGNVLRVMMRILNSKENVLEEAVRKKVTKALTETLKKYNVKHPGDFNEGMMELGETICIPNTKPICNECPIKNFCKAYKENTQETLPIRIKKNRKKEENLTVFLIIYQNKVAVSYREEKGLLHHMYEFPNINKKLTKQETEAYLKSLHITGKITKGPSHTHIFTHKKWKMQSYIIELTKEIKTYKFYTIKEIEENLALPTAFVPFLKVIKKNKLTQNNKNIEK